MHKEFNTLTRQSLDQAPYMLLWLGADGSLIYGNISFQKNTGYLLEEGEKRWNISSFLPDYHKNFLTQDWPALKNGVTIKDRETYLKTRSGISIPVELSASLIHFKKKEYACVLLYNITRKKKNQAEVKLYLKEMNNKHRSVLKENQHLKEILKSDQVNIISVDPAYQKVLAQVEKVANAPTTVLIMGETGTGKELLAKAIHRLSPQSDNLMVTINCSTLPAQLIESELFGHEKGAFTGAYKQKIGKFEQAAYSTLFLDEVGELPLELQAKLLRVLQEGTFERLGGNHTIHSHTRIIAATNRDLKQMIRNGQFREDLFYRLHVFPIYNIPLRERREDIPPLINFFIKKYNKKHNKNIERIFSDDLNNLMGYPFLGNIRELENMVERAVILTTGKTLRIHPEYFNEKEKRNLVKFKTMEEMQRDHIRKALKRTLGRVSGNTGAAQLLGMNDKTLRSRMKKLGISRNDY